MTFSIITINYNNLQGLKKTFESVISQTCIDFEYIIIDGGSSDGSSEFIIGVEDKISYWVSERDNGIYDAMNKGIHKSSGDYIYFLNSGDIFHDSYVLNNIANQLLIKNKIDLVLGSVITNNDLKNCYNITDFLDYLKKYRAIPHQGVFIRSKLFEILGIYDIQLNILADQEFFIRYFKYSNNVEQINLIFSKLEPNGLGSKVSIPFLIDKIKIEFQHFMRFKHLLKHIYIFLRIYLRNKMHRSFDV